jgi:hypothetical protein
MKAHRYILEPYKGIKSRYRCPSCQHKEKTFSLYIDTNTGEHIHPSVGRCNRESNCGQNYTPKQYFQDNNISFDTPQPKAYKPQPITPQPKPVSYISFEAFEASLKSHETNHFVNYLINLFGADVASKLVSSYFIGSSKYWNGATVFWQIDVHRKVRTGKIMLYSPITGKRTKEPFNHISWAHKALKQPNFELKQCLYGEHLLNVDENKSKNIAIVESEKTAIIASAYLPQFIWLAIGSLTNLNAERCKVLKGRTVILFPDLKAFEKWSSKAKELSHIATFHVSDLLERKATESEKQQGFDLADYLIKFDFKLFNKPQPTQSIQVESNCEYNIPASQQLSFEFWNIDDIESYFASIEYNQKQIKIDKCGTITDLKKFVESHVATVKSNNGKPTFKPYYDRLEQVKNLLST